MQYNFNEIEKKWQDWWKENQSYKVPNDFSRPKFYVLDMFPYPSGAGLHVGHPLGYIASDIFSRFKRLKGFNVLHPMGYDAFGLPAEQYAIEHGVHPAISTEQNIANFRKQLDKIGFCFDWDREVNTSDPAYYKWTQWIFLQLFDSFYNRVTNKAEPIDILIKEFEWSGTDTRITRPVSHAFTAAEWNSFDEAKKQNILMDHRLAYCGYGEVNWCEALGTVLANDEVINGVSERGGHPVVKKKLRQWYLRITEYADRLLEGLDRIEFSEAMKEMQTNWIGKSSGAEIEFKIRLTPSPSPGGEGSVDEIQSGNYFKTADSLFWKTLKEYGRENRKNQTEAEDKLWQEIRNNRLGVKVRRQHAIQGYIVDFAMLEVKLAIEIDGAYHDEAEQRKYDEARTAYISEFDIKLLRFTNEEVLQSIDDVLAKIRESIKEQRSKITSGIVTPLLREEKGLGDEAVLRVYTTRPDTIFGVDFMVIAPEHELVNKITSDDKKQAVDEYLSYVKSRSERERMAEKEISGVFTGAYALNPFDQRAIPIWISEYVLAGYGTGAIMAVPCGDERDHKFAQHFNIPITNIIGEHYTGEANATKDAKLQNSGFLNGMIMREAIDVVITRIEEAGIGSRKINYKMRDAAFSRQRYWGEPFPIIWINGTAYPLDITELPLVLPKVDSYSPGPEGEGPLANIPEWVNIPSPPAPLHGVERGATRAAAIPKYAVHTPKQYELAKEMRKGHTKAEGILWELLRNSKLGEKFRRQHPVDAYIVDFICLQKRLIVEVDGGYHENEEQKLYDDQRIKTLNDIGFEVIRFTNEEVEKEGYRVRDKIQLKLKESVNDSPLRMRRGAGGEGHVAMRETNTMPGYAGSSWYFLRYMDPHNDQAFCDRKISDYWGQVDLYIGGTEHAVGHLLYSRMWTKALYDLGYIGYDEPYKKLVNQGMIQGSSRFVYRLNFAGIERKLKDFLQTHFEEYNFVTGDFDEPIVCDFKGKFEDWEYLIEISRFDKLNSKSKKILSNLSDQGKASVIAISNEEFLWQTVFGDAKKWFGNILRTKANYQTEIKKNITLFISKNIRNEWDEWCYDTLHVDVNIVDGVELNKDAFRKWKPEYSDAIFICEDGSIALPTGEGRGGAYICGSEVEKMSKSKFNTVNPDELVERYGADTFRMYEMFLGPVEMSKPWDTKGIEGVHRFLKKLWRLFYDELKGKLWTQEKATAEELKILHRTIKKIEEDTERFSFNTAVSAFMICVNELADLKCHKKEILQPLLVLVTPYAPHIAEELWSLLGNSGSILDARYPLFEATYIAESSKEYPVSVNGKLRTTINLSLDLQQPEVEQIVLKNEVIQKWLEGKSPKKIIFVKGKMVNVVI